MRDIRVTITGADDGVYWKDLLHLSHEYPFVEWGILMSPRLSGVPRYPNSAWIREWQDYLLRTDPGELNSALHLCGGYATRPNEMLVDALKGFKRIQLNLGGVLTEEARGVILQDSPQKIIVQVRDRMQAEKVWFDCGNRAELLFDASGGRGMWNPDGWPTCWTMFTSMGYAGGITPENIYGALDIVSERTKHQVRDKTIWIDMETGVRTDDKFDFKKVELALRKAAAWRNGIWTGA